MDVLTEFHLDILFYYQAPNRHDIEGRIVPEGMEFAELVLSGRTVFETQEGDREFGRGWLFWHRAGERTIHRIVNGDPYSCLCFQFHALPECLMPKISRWGDPDTMDEFLQFVTRERIKVRTGRELEIFEHVVRGRLMEKAHPWRSMADESPDNPAGQQILPAPLHRAVELLERDNLDDMQLDAVSRAAGVSKSYLYSLFRTYLNTNPHHYILEQRIRKAAFLLRSSNLPVKDIAQSCRFVDLRHFYRVFQRFFHCTPRSYRDDRRLQQEKEPDFSCFTGGGKQN